MQTNNLNILIGSTILQQPSQRQSFDDFAAFLAEPIAILSDFCCKWLVFSASLRFKWISRMAVLATINWRLAFGKDGGGSPFANVAAASTEPAAVSPIF